MNRMQKILEQHELILMEAAIVERLRRSENIKLDDQLLNAPLIYDDVGKKAMLSIYQEYIDVASAVNVPFLMCTPTWRANQARVTDASIRSEINQDTVLFLRHLRDKQGQNKANIKIGGLIGCKNDCYLPEQALSAPAAEQFHSWQVNQLVQAGVDFLIGETLPSTQEALGIAKAMERTGVPYIISFVISRDGKVLDGCALPDAITLIDGATVHKPLCYAVNCAYPTFLSVESQPEELFSRLMGYCANASSLDHCELENATEVKVDDLNKWGDSMLRLNQQHNMRILGGCCGTGTAHLRYLLDGSRVK